MESREFSSAVTQDEHILAALAHASVILPFWGLIGAIVVWATQREKSRFVGFQALQAIAYQLALIIGGFAGGVCHFCSFFATFLLMPVGIFVAEGTGNPSAEGLIAVITTFFTVFFPFCLLGVFMLIGLAFVLYGLYGAVRVLQGHDFRYVVVGRWLEQYLNREEVAE